MAELLALLLVLGVAALAIAWPLLDEGSSAAPVADPELEALQVRHRLALEALRDVEADHRAGALDDAAYQAERREAEAQAVETRRALDAATPPAIEPEPARPRRGKLLAGVPGGALALLLLVGYVLPAPWGVAEKDARLERIRQLTDMVADNPGDTAALAELSDQYLAGGTSEDVAAALASLILLRNAEPDSRDANERLITLLIRTGLWDQAAGATDAYAGVAGDDEPDIPFFRGLIARGRGDAAEARQQFQRFLELAPNDDRAPMVRGLMAPASPAPSATNG